MNESIPQKVEVEVDDLKDLIEYARNSTNYEYDHGGVREHIEHMEALIAPAEPDFSTSVQNGACTAKDPAHDLRCTKPAGHEGSHASVRDGWVTLTWDDPETCKAEFLEDGFDQVTSECALPKDHAGMHHHTVREPEICGKTNPNSYAKCTRLPGHSGPCDLGRKPGQTSPYVDVEPTKAPASAIADPEIDKVLGIEREAAPKSNYRRVNLDGHARSGVANVDAFMCKGCGTLVGDKAAHDQWHADIYERLDSDEGPTLTQWTACGQVDPDQADGMLHPCILPAGHRPISSAKDVYSHLDNTGRRWRTS